MSDAEQNTLTIIGRAAGPDGEGVEVRLTDVAPDAPDVSEGLDDGLRDSFRKYFSAEPTSVAVVTLPYLDHIDGTDDDG